ncbi:MAG: RNA-directed DNA polymerase [Magnetococcales bacterium]|nr:RNA-directed DNA polymerase [Magnetococcales bacterium]
MEFPLHNYLNSLRDSGARVEYISAIRRNAQPLVDCGLPVILTLGHLAHVTDVSHGILADIIKRQIDPYRVFAIRKRSGGKRFICVPEKGLLTVQRWIHKEILCAPVALRKLSCHATAYAPLSSHIVNAKRHIGAAWILKLDITRFFESVSERQVYRVFRGLGYRALVAFCLTRLCTRVLPSTVDHRLRLRTKRWQTGDQRNQRNFPGARVIGHLPQGAPTSPMLANLVCVKLDADLQKIAAREGLTYTRYADDMTFSGEVVDRAAAIRISREISIAVGHYGFGINLQKTSIAKNGGRKIVTGLSVDGEVVRLPRAYKDAIRQELFYLDKHGIQGHCARIGHKNHLSYLLRLAGRIRYAISIEPVIGQRMMEKFLRIFPTFLETEQMVAQVFVKDD